MLLGDIDWITQRIDITIVFQNIGWIPGAAPDWSAGWWTLDMRLRKNVAFRRRIWVSSGAFVQYQQIRLAYIPSVLQREVKRFAGNIGWKWMWIRIAWRHARINTVGEAAGWIQCPRWSCQIRIWFYLQSVSIFTSFHTYLDSFCL